jgi:hypothetical protein
MTHSAEGHALDVRLRLKNMGGTGLFLRVDLGLTEDIKTALRVIPEP